jgi:putative ABC transport system permease protein
VDRFAADVRRAVRSIARSPGVTVPALLCLALGIGLGTATFSVVDALLVRPLPYPDPARLVLLFDVTQGAQGRPEQYNASAPNFLAWKAESRLLDHVVAMDGGYRDLTGGQPERVGVAAVSQGFFDLLGAKAAEGRTFLPAEDRPGAPLVAVLSHAFWEKRFSRRGIGFPIALRGKSYSVVGVLEPGFEFMRAAQVWVPLGIDETHQPEAPTTHYLFTAARLAPGATIARARAELGVIAGRLAVDRPATNARWTVDVVSLREHLVGSLRPILLLLLAAVGSLLLIACGNVGSLLLIRTVRRLHEIAVRLALGAGQRRIMSLLLAESTVLSLTGGALGVALAALGIRILPRVGPQGLAPLPAVHLDLRVLAFALGLALLSGLIAVLPAALGVPRLEVAGRLQAAARHTTQPAQGRRLLSLPA